MYENDFNKLPETLVITGRPLFPRCLRSSQPLERVLFLLGHASTVQLLGSNLHISLGCTPCSVMD